MIHVIASIQVKPGRVHEFLEIFKANIPAVRAEKGCIEYFPTMDVNTGLPVQALDKNRVTILERWESPEALKDHLATPHMSAYREKVKDLVVELTLHVLQDAHA